MPIVIDVNAFIPVFQDSCTHHLDFKPVHDWLLSGKGAIVCGGKKYRDELGLAKLRLLNQLAASRRVKVVRIDDGEVNRVADELSRIITDKRCNDHHLISLLKVSRCPLICTRDKESYEFIKRKSLYQKPYPRIYSSKKNAGLLKRVYALDKLRYVVGGVL